MAIRVDVNSVVINIVIQLVITVGALSYLMAPVIQDANYDIQYRNHALQCNGIITYADMEGNFQTLQLHWKISDPSPIDTSLWLANTVPNNKGVWKYEEFDCAPVVY